MTNQNAQMSLKFSINDVTPVLAIKIGDEKGHAILQLFVAAGTSRRDVASFASSVLKVLRNRIDERLAELDAIFEHLDIFVPPKTLSDGPTTMASDMIIDENVP